ncbi:hypothetical protein [Cysteiniphilum halobium]|uniref:hypothetical protein n=1 Tax=Cysteiniphilum halobium TaxID=2219059 RepID=UPI000E648084|nr:hypothetical protein [Cysteiniphilum halobium]
MTTVKVRLKRSVIQLLFIFLLFSFCLFIIFHLLHAVLFYSALFLWGTAFIGMLLSYLLSKKLHAIALIETVHARKIHLQYGDHWYNDVTVRRSIMIAGTLYLECKLTPHKRLKLWLFRDNFKNREDRYQFIRFLVLADK